MTGAIPDSTTQRVLNCGLEIEIVFDRFGNLKEVKPKTIN